MQVATSGALQPAFHNLQNLARLGVAAQGLFAVQKLAVHFDLVHPALGRDQREFRDLGLEISKQFGCQTGSPVGVMSNSTVLNANSEHPGTPL